MNRCLWLCLAVAVACGKSPQGLPCGDTQCIVGQVCCIDCNGRGLCGGPNFVCAGFACATDGGSDAGVGPDGGTRACGDTACLENQVCCIDCTGHGTCGPPGTSCPGNGCQCGGTSETCCASVPSCANGLTCCSGIPYPTGGECLSQCSAASDRNIKSGFQSVDPRHVLDAVAAMPVSSWYYDSEGPSTRHLGPMAQDFHTAFGLGASDTRIDFVDGNGVLLVAVQALHQDVQRLERENARLSRKVEQLERHRDRDSR
jgi:hypothetical protein